MPKSDDSHAVIQLMFDGSESTLATYQRFDLAQRYAEILAGSIARTDSRRAWLGQPTSGIMAIICGYDVWRIPEIAQGLRGVHGVAANIPRQDAHAHACALAHSSIGYSHDGRRI